MLDTEGSGEVEIGMLGIFGILAFSAEKGVFRDFGPKVVSSGVFGRWPWIVELAGFLGPSLSLFKTYSKI